MIIDKRRIIIIAANRVGLRKCDLNNKIIEVIEYAINKYKYWDNIENEIKWRLGVDKS